MKTILAALCAGAIALLSGTAAEPAAKSRVLLVTGIDYPGHLWRETAPVLADALRQDPRLDVVVVEDPSFLDSSALTNYAAVFLHFQNWQTPGPGAHARENLKRFVENGGGVVLAHFACGAWYGEWPEFGKIAGRTWAGPGPEVRQHDPFGQFTVQISAPEHPVTKTLQAFDTKDELYTCLVGDHPVQVLAEAKSKVDGKMYPMAFVSQCGKGRTFHSVLGHDAAALKIPQVGELFRRGTAWAAGLQP